ncbi:Eco57I restriction-modification methylase domain-containing protein [Halomonas aquamarina]|uniref:Eco57I restriction-modification methylase domain-containing protein n=1 Tax=Vreelandella aquamarina TaxID=77097 RepID=A0ACC5VPR0_9GAMM|nr:Eco57I restriction-modification methylase domain-containing protein [Halomonas aquamarina]MBZ5486196.1 Eco57I restriction-modification methylase domain-containing protein [Halomonas aquamarina]
MTLQLDLAPANGDTLNCPISEASELLATQGELEARGAIYTRIEVVECILNLVGYTTDQPLADRCILEPAFGEGDFLIPVAERLVAAWLAQKSSISVVEALKGSLRGVELHRPTFEITKQKLCTRLVELGLDAESSQILVNTWLLQDDFLLLPDNSQFDFVVGNPPYVRQERIPAPLLQEYRRRYKTLYDRADIYVPFMERSLSLLNNGGHLGFICADRWMKNKYGGPLRELVSKDFWLKYYVDMVNTPAFHAEVMAYPAITVISREAPGSTRVAYRPAVDRQVLSNLAVEFKQRELHKADKSVREVTGVTNGSEPWLLDNADELSIVRRMESLYPKLEEVGCKVGIGVATGADKAFIADFESLDVEPDRKLKLAKRKDINSGVVNWTGLGVINPFKDEGGLVDLSDYPRLAAYLEKHREQIAGRHVAKKTPKNWYRTIDRIFPKLAESPKLLIPDINGQSNVVYEKGELYPHHNLYYITSTSWDLRALQAVLLSEVAKLFVATYSTQMRGGFIRFQAQYLRRIRLPSWDEVSDVLKKNLIAAAKNGDTVACNEAAYELYGLTEKEKKTVRGGASDS